MKQVKVMTDFITLGQFLKYINLIESGSMAKNFLVNNKVLVNNTVEERRGKKLYPNDTIDINNIRYVIVKDKWNE